MQQFNVQISGLKNRFDADDGGANVIEEKVANRVFDANIEESE